MDTSCAVGHGRRARPEHGRSARDGESALVQPERPLAVVAERYRNRAVTDIFEPGSSFKPFVLAAAIESGSFKPTHHHRHVAGLFSVNDRIITEDDTNLGAIPLTTVLAQSSNVGAARVALTMEPQTIWQT